MILCLCLLSFSGCGMLNENGGEGKKIISEVIDSVVGEGAGSAITNVVFSLIGGDDWSGWDDTENSGWGLSGIGGNAAIDASYSNIDGIKSGDGKATVMIYMIGSNLESEGGCATSDIQEMLNADIGSNVNLLIQAGGAKKWKNNIIDPSKLGTYKVEDGTLVEVNSKKKSSMVDPANLTEFISWGVKNYPADSYSLIFWDHGGGTIAGFGMDELFSGDLSIADISSAIRNSGAHFKFIGFDACLMGTVETAYSLKSYADYFVAAEEEEPGAGWHYTNWLKALSKNPGLDMETLGKIIVDDFVADNNKKGDNVTLSVIDLSKIDNVYSKLSNVCASCNDYLVSGQTKTVTNARSKAKAFGSGQYDQIDIIDFCQKSEVDGANELINAVNEAVVYHKTNMTGTNGLAMYFPYKLSKYYDMMSKMFVSISMNDKSCSSFFNNFLSVIAGRGTSSKSMSPMAVNTGYQEETVDYSEEEWYEYDIIDSVDDFTEFELDEYGEITLYEDEEAGDYCVCLSEEEYELTDFMAVSAYLDDGEGYIDLGMDDTYYVSENDDGSADIYLNYDNSWFALNGQIVPYYALGRGTLANGQDYSEGEVYCSFVDGKTGVEKDIVIEILFNLDTNDIEVLGYRNDVEEGSQAARKLFKFKDGDIIQPLCDYYTYDGEYDDEYLFGDEILVDGELIASYEDIGESEVQIGLYLRDIYNTEYWSSVVDVYTPEE